MTFGLIWIKTQNCFCDSSHHHWCSHLKSLIIVWINNLTIFCFIIMTSFYSEKYKILFDEAVYSKASQISHSFLKKMWLIIIMTMSSYYLLLSLLLYFVYIVLSIVCFRFWSFISGYSNIEDSGSNYTKVTLGLLLNP